MPKNLNLYWPAIVICLVSIIIGCLIYQDYGLSWDELSQREVGRITYDYAIGEYADFDNYLLKDHGPGFEWVLMLIEKKMGITFFRDIFLMRHLVTFIFFTICIISFYSFILKLFDNKWLAAIAAIAVLYHPRIFAHGFFNPKDIPGLSMFVLSIATAQWAFRKQQLLPFAILGIICGYSASIRLMNIVVAVPLILFFLADIVAARKSKQNAGKPIMQAFTVLSFGCLSLYASWPTLWANPIDSFVEVYNSYAKFYWPNDLRFMGEVINATELPWYYIPVWFLITVPELWLILGFLGIGIFIVRLLRQPIDYFQDQNKRGITISFILLFLPLMMVILLKSVLYDGWRHLYFIYPCFITFAVYTIYFIKKPILKKIVYGLCFVQILILAGFMVKYHPYQQVYFNHFVSHKPEELRKGYELDYWGACMKEALEWIAEHDGRRVIHVNGNIGPLLDNQYILEKHIAKRFRYTLAPYEYDYYIQFYRTYYDFSYPCKEVPGVEIVHEKKVLNSTIYRIVKMH